MNARSRAAALVAVVSLALLAVLALVRGAPGDSTTTATTDTTMTTTTTPEDPRVPELRRKLAHERVLLRRARHRTLGVVRTLRHRPSTQEALTLACSTYGSCTTLRRRAWCESRDDSTQQNPTSGASGLFQFLPSTWRSTPYAGASIWSPYASALAAGWMQAHGRGGEWACR